ncbi:diaminopimelate epimerase [Malaciobacter mytili]|uniref:Diaminopimelate epimerase n=1 Tax=Malaciobacter mytili LMG 24559 TaxID=1032238 RepID=A0AAX2AE16_9BACT|nr:diaminopimelate epimerase [Malaciobacter mytili]AXH13771.1 diaminopimelate epimerase [Malaciobacter mytili LMG 24559]RXI42142.1 diaminopimelate epimerase [Malaciobacter mytili]RXK12914.1 diaminopimelate epimerase [Malaciobacter mytili LMG 24559]
MTYTKYSASGNDFVIFHSFIKKDYSQEAIKLCNRTEGIGADGLIVLVPHEKYDFEWLFYNSDGSHAAMCGNGTRACAHYAYTNGLASSKMQFLTGAGVIESTVEENIVETQLTKPVILKEEFEQEGFTWYIVDTGVPHLVTIVEDLEKYDHNLASKMRYEHNANVNFAKIQDGKVYVRTYERGVEGETLACGTGMAACFLRANSLGLVGNIAKVYPKSKEELTLTKKDETLYFKGAVKKVFTTSIN